MIAPISIYALGDSAITIDLGDRIDPALNRKALTIRGLLVSLGLSGVLDIVVAYSSVTLFYDPVLIRAGQVNCEKDAFACLKTVLERAWLDAVPAEDEQERSIQIPVCYEGVFAPDLDGMAKQKGLSGEELICLHTSRVYRVYMIGFLPGFAYLGTVDPQLEIPRKRVPVPVLAGSVGIAGSQTGLYPLNSPGGWQIIGRTPVKLFDPQEETPVFLQTGDQVRFVPISLEEFGRLSAQGI